MQTLEQAMQDLKAGYRHEALARVDRTCRSLEAGCRRERLQEAFKTFHSFAGSGATYGFARVSELGLEGERAVGEMLDADAAGVGSEKVEQWLNLLSAIRSELMAEPTEAAPSVPAQKNRATLDILVVDDDEALADHLCRLLAQEGYGVRLAHSSQAALRAVEARLPDAMLVDIRLPDGNGYQLVEQVRALAGGEAPAIFMISVKHDFLDKVEAIHCGADAFFVKPINRDALLLRLDQLVGPRNAERQRILSVEDDPQQAAYVRAVLESAGYEVRVCDDPTRFEDELISFQPDLVLLDIVLPGVSGYDLARFLRQDERHAALPVLVLTTQGQLEARMEATRAGADDYLTKPVPPSLLLTSVAARIEKARTLKSLIDRDGLTRLLSHTAFVERARAAAARASRFPERPTVWVMIDLDRFKSVNDTYGHPTGDRVLTALASLLRRRMRQSDTVGRYGGEEFAAIIEDLDEDSAACLVDRLLREFSDIPHRAPDGSTFRVTFSAGVARLDPRTPGIERWSQAADVALYRAKAAGRGRVVTARTDRASQD